ncbi:MAG: hypothetical protein LBV45_08190 [Xanthomonadaceae bacterium]|jgi:hypothetical protein|nr:hypothetical protein [Xanthomonadaceae bacterium]
MPVIVRGAAGRGGEGRKSFAVDSLGISPRHGRLHVRAVPVADIRLPLNEGGGMPADHRRAGTLAMNDGETRNEQVTGGSHADL